MIAKYLPLLLFPCLTFAQDAEVSPVKKLAGFGAQDTTLKASRDSSDAAGNTGELANYDSLKRSDVSKLDSIVADFNHSVDSIKQLSNAPLASLQEKWNKLNTRRQRTRGKPEKRIEKKMDTVRSQTGKCVDTLNARITKLKSKTNMAIQKANLPAEASGEVEKLKGSISRYALPAQSLNNEMGLNIPDLSRLSPLERSSVPGLDKVPINTGNLDGGALNKITPELPKSVNEVAGLGKINSVDQGVEKIAQEKLKSQGIDTPAMPANSDNLSEQLSKELENQGKEAVNHFAGKEKELQGAIDNVSKYKEKYANVKDVTALPKHYNPLKEWKWWQRLTPGLLFFVQQKSGTYIDLGPYLGWRLNSHFTTSLGWSERISIQQGNMGVAGHDRVHGLTSSVSYLWKHGLALRISPEYVQSYVSEGNLRAVYFRWHARLLAGIRKDFTIYKKMSGFTDFSYNFLRLKNATEFGEAFFVRFGIEWKIKVQ